VILKRFLERRAAEWILQRGHRWHGYCWLNGYHFEKEAGT
jgi:hypothetical protein